MFAPAHHQATRLRDSGPPQLAVRTIFNFLGPLTNPAGATRQLIGVSDPDYLETMAGALALLGTEHALLVSGEDGVDELSISAPTPSSRCATASFSRYTVTPEEVGLERAAPAAVPGATRSRTPTPRGASSPASAAPPRDLAVLNAGAAIYAGGGADSLEQGVRAAERAIDGGAATAALERFVARTQELAGRVNALEPIVAATREEVASAARARAATPSSSRGGAGGRRAAPVRGGARAPRAVGDRRAQAALAVGRRDPRGPAARGRRRRLRARRRGGAVDPHRGAELRWLARRSAGGARGVGAADPAQGLHRRRLPAARGAGGGRRRDPADRRRARPGRARAAARDALRSGSRRWSRSTTSASSSAPPRSAPG